jgi:quercetin dioxygenase-like cupin family protein
MYCENRKFRTLLKFNIMFYFKNEDDYRDLINGIQYKMMCTGEGTSMFLFKIPKNAAIPSHNHIHEQTGFMVSGKMTFKIGEEERVVESGDSWAIPPNVFHEVKAHEDCEVIEVFSPIREDYL